ncbi:MAG: MBL fold metallo-hydrolase [Planctomycetota bacterium]|jgi:ribonuclease BN (tRNA processing enzyme)
MLLTVLGSGNGVPRERRGCPGLLLRNDAGTECVLVDPGAGSLTAAARAGAGPGDITSVLVTHLHLDHHVDVLSLLFARHHSMFADLAPLRIVGPPGFRRVHDLWEEAYGHWLRPGNGETRIDDWSEGVEPMGDLQVEAVRVPHGTVEACGFRIRESGNDEVLVYTGDTGEGDEVVDFARDADLLVTECTLAEGAETDRHLTASAAGRVAAASGARRLLLVHFGPEVDGTPVESAVRRHYAGPLLLADDGMEIRL